MLVSLARVPHRPNLGSKFLPGVYEKEEERQLKGVPRVQF